MTITLTLTPEVEHKLREAAAINGETVEQYIARLAEQSVAGGSDPSAIPYEEWRRRFQEWLAGHEPSSGIVDDDRDSIYAGRGE